MVLESKSPQNLQNLDFLFNFVDILKPIPTQTMSSHGWFGIYGAHNSTINGGNVNEKIRYCFRWH